MAIDRRGFVHGSLALGGIGMLPAAGAAVAAAEGEADPLFNQPFIDIDEWRDKPFRHRYVHGGFTGTNARFVMYFPPKAQYQGRFFQSITAVPVSEEMAANVFGGTDNFVGFCFDSGAAAVASNMGGFDATAAPGKTVDPTISTYRVSAATARFARLVAGKMYGAHRTYGYAFGGSGGGYRTLGCAQNSSAFDGVVPFMHPAPAAIPNGFAARIRGLRILQDKFPQIVDALEPGGSGDVYAGLTAEQREVLTEITRHGFPVRTWAFHETMGIGAFAILYQGVQAMDPAYFTDFWTKPGYLGADKPERFAEARIQHRTKVVRVIMSNEAATSGAPAPGRMARGATADAHLAWQNLENDYGGKPLPVGLELQSPPSGESLVGTNINIVTGPNAGKTLVLGGMTGNLAMFQFGPTTGSLREVTEAIRAGQEVQIDNSNFLAFETYYRHALLPSDSYVCNQFRHADGTPIYPQRRVLQNHGIVEAAVGSQLTGDFNGKMIVLQHLLDWDGHPWFADWYRSKVRARLGSRFADKYRVYYIDHATHGQTPDPTRTVPYAGALQQALRDVAAWVERGVTPPQETDYRVEEAQVLLPAAAVERKGLQPVVALTADGGERAEVRVGQPVEFKALVDAAPGTGAIVAAEWDFDSTSVVVAGEENRFPIAESFRPASRLALVRQHAFSRPGTYFVALRVHSQRSGNAATPYARVANLGRVRVVVA